jgi:hypothetical protein
MRNRNDYEDDFDIVPDEDATASPVSRWLWVILTAVVALFAFGVGAAFMILTNRMSSSAPPTPTVAQAVVTTPTQVAMLTTTATLTAVVTVTATQTPSPTATPLPTPTPFCTVRIEEPFIALYDPALGCARAPAAIVWSAYQPFERGSMLWRSDTDTAYVFYSAGTWFPVQEQWDGSAVTDRGAPPPGLIAPERGFGYVWSRSDSIFTGLGWARDREKGFCALVQSFERGFILRSADVASCTPDGLYNFATAADWIPLLIVAEDQGGWRNTASPNLDPTQGGDRPAAAISRPSTNGQFEARPLLGATLDGNLSDWPNAWQPLNALVLGPDQHSGPGDLSANFQVAWNTNGLILAVRVNDERYRPGPQGSDQWQGDGLEVQFDRLLAEDFTTPGADSDDYQVGIAFDDSLRALRGYLWLPYAREARVEIPGSVIATDTGYQLEALIPWYLFELDGATLSTDRAYGFNLSINDNDADSPIQQTVLSASPARTTHDNPTEWGTLRLLP